MNIIVNRRPNKFKSDPSKVIARYFFIGPEKRAQSIIQKVVDMPDEAAKMALNRTLRDFSSRHRNISKIFNKHYERTINIVYENTEHLNNIPNYKKMIIGAYFTSEYSIESAAFFNPSIIEDPDQTGLLEGQLRVIISFRATGEGHISSIVFRGGILDVDNSLVIEDASNFVEEPDTIQDHVFNKKYFNDKLVEMQTDMDIAGGILNDLGNQFDFSDLGAQIEKYIMTNNPSDITIKMLQTISAYADSNYDITFSLDTAISERVIFPIASSESNGIEDARFVKFTDDDGSITYYATYTAYNGVAILPKLIETKDFYTFNTRPLQGKYVQNKGMALFPRKVNGKYAMLSRIDDENNYVMFSDNIDIWNEAIKIQTPDYPWEFVKIGNCGSPIETKYGWLLITHGVGPMRKYCIGASMLDIDDPTKTIGRLSDPLLAPNEEEREGYVPNVVYSCGCIIHNDELILPYASSDTLSTYATVPLENLFSRLLPTNYKKEGLTADKIKAKILLVEDDVITQLIVSEILKNNNYEVEVASDGIVALIQISKGYFDLVISDINMPNFDGFQLLDYFKQNNISIPVAVISAGVEGKETERLSLEKGASAYIEKPIKKDIFLSQIETLLQ